MLESRDAYSQRISISDANELLANDNCLLRGQVMELMARVDVLTERDLMQAAENEQLREALERARANKS